MVGGQAPGPAPRRKHGRQWTVDNERARTLLVAERTRVEGLIAGPRVDRTDNRDVEDERPARPFSWWGCTRGRWQRYYREFIAISPTADPVYPYP
jgi:hypothetical protein